MRNVIKKSSFKLNPLSDRYRICPNCKKGHMITHGKRDFCSDKCNDDYNNRLKKDLRLLIQSEEHQVQPNDVIEKIVEPMAEIKPQNQKLRDNIAIIDSYEIEPNGYSIVEMQDLEDAGYDFDVYSGLFRLYNIPKKYIAFFTVLGRYRFYRLEDTTFIIFKKQEDGLHKN
ncbi:MAG: hypothetical protein M0D57_08315 [Sphingobacteriales bacterium JAD_PAG50586_3]|nr:MAG: hypothetical protein M0D57_08315 [Sphingobacteriales bacterium JAD_PAG50586_3]